MYVNIDARKSVKLTEGWLEHRSSSGDWRRYWCVLRDDAIFLFNCKRESEETLAGKIALNPGSRFEKLDGPLDQGSGYKFKLCTERRTNNFKASNFAERELWKAYVEGITHGKVSDDIDLLPGIIEDVRNNLKQFSTNRPPANTSNKESGNSGLKDGFDTPDSSTSGCFSLRFDQTGYLVPVSPSAYSQKYRFFEDPSSNKIPSWFFASCSRDLAVKILKLGARYGNTLMRESTNTENNLVISKRMETASKEQEFTHYKLKSTPQGYILEVENEHKPMQTLSEVMDFFVLTSGVTTTRPMICNNLQTLGIQDVADNDYNRNIITIQQDADSGEESPLDFIAPPIPHIQKKAVNQHNTLGPHKHWNTRSVSVPNISSEELKQVQASQAARLGQVSSLSRGSKNSHLVMTHMESQGASHQPSYLSMSGAKPPTVQPKSTSSSKETPPSLPPNHPPPLKKAHSQSGMPLPPDNSSSNARKTGPPKHTQSVSSADRQVRNLSPRDQHSASQVKDELVTTTRITKQKEELLDPAIISSKPATHLEPQEDRSQPVTRENFKKNLESMLANKLIPGTRPRAHSVTTDLEYESLDHYQNSSAIQNARK